MRLVDWAKRDKRLGHPAKVNRRRCRSLIFFHFPSHSGEKKMKNCLKCFQFINYFFTFFLLAYSTYAIRCLPAIKSHSNVSFQLKHTLCMSCELNNNMQSECVRCGGGLCRFTVIHPRRRRLWDEGIHGEENWKLQRNYEIHVREML